MYKLPAVALCKTETRQDAEVPGGTLIVTGTFATTGKPFAAVAIAPTPTVTYAAVVTITQTEFGPGGYAVEFATGPLYTVVKVG